MDDLSKLFSKIDVSKGQPYRVKAPPSPRVKKIIKNPLKKWDFYYFIKQVKK